MKSNILLIITFLSLSLFTSCKKGDLTPGSYTQTTPSNTSNNQTYTNGGTIGTSTTTTNNQAVGTTWLLTYMKKGFSTPPLPVDTIRFIDNVNYTINGGGIRPYQLTSGNVSSLILTLNYHFPFGSGNYSGQVSSTFVIDGVISACVFNDINDLTHTSPNITATFIKF